MSASNANTNLFLRSDTLFGTCQAIGDDFGFNPNWLRVPLAATMVLSPAGAIGGYLALSLLVLLSRSLFKAKPAPVAAETPQVVASPIEANDDAQRELIAA